MKRKIRELFDVRSVQDLQGLLFILTSALVLIGIVALAVSKLKQ